MFTAGKESDSEVSNGMVEEYRKVLVSLERQIDSLKKKHKQSDETKKAEIARRLSSLQAMRRDVRLSLKLLLREPGWHKIYNLPKTP